MYITTKTFNYVELIIHLLCKTILPAKNPRPEGNYALKGITASVNIIINVLSILFNSFENRQIRMRQIKMRQN